jgi:hypothetical protein
VKTSPSRINAGLNFAISCMTLSVHRCNIVSKYDHLFLEPAFVMKFSFNMIICHVMYSHFSNPWHDFVDSDHIKIWAL